MKRALLLFLLVVGAPALAADYDSAYTSLELGDCRQEALNPDDPLGGGVWWCQGYDGMPVRVAEGDLRYLVSFGAGAANEPAAEETLPQFNRIGTTLEWRLERDPASGSWRPIATILRYFTEGESGSEGQVLVVSKIGGPGQVCHVGYVDALANKGANALARQVAETVAPGFVCGRDSAVYYGTTVK